MGTDFFGTVPSAGMIFGRSGETAEGFLGVLQLFGDEWDVGRVAERCIVPDLVKSFGKRARLIVGEFQMGILRRGTKFR